MASRASSEAAASSVPARIPELPGLGTTWYARGPRYWLRRTVNALFLLVVLAFFCYIALVLYSGAPRTCLPHDARRAWDIAQIVASCATIVWGWVSQRRKLRRQLQDPPTPHAVRAVRRTESRRAVYWSRAGLIPLLLAAPVLPPIVAWCVGAMAALLAVRESPSEVGARRWLEAQKGRGGTSRG
ncbi:MULTISPECIES: hypothetical protein [unclassified Streptomyces]|uniref:hypothetical protein n=1 Tax=unclassified Streptomyces TaxID=2593676 RepID=UPI0019168C1E|nr:MULTISPECIES: hypothetical protein [unclassified Streptomyces]WKE68808.1 hypothetical protein QHG49_07130 [Streptomyces sp. WP-1]